MLITRALRFAWRSGYSDSVKSPPMEKVAREVAARLRESGHIAYFAGGCVRDMVRGLIPKDYDIVTDARPEAVQGIFQRTVAVGAHFGVIIVLEDGFQFEVATFRSDDAYIDGRHPSAVHFSSPEEDAQRRDFTINGMFYDPVAEEVIDFVGGRADIDAKLVRAIGDPARRFAEDRLRMLRAVRFATALDYQIDKQTWDALVANAGLLAACTRAAAQALGLPLVAPRAHGDALTALYAPPGLETSAIVKGLKSEFGSTVAGGQGELKGKILRIAHLGYYDLTDILGLLATLEIVLRRVGHRFEPGRGVAAAEEEYLRRRPSSSRRAGRTPRGWTGSRPGPAPPPPAAPRRPTPRAAPGRSCRARAPVTTSARRSCPPPAPASCRRARGR